MNNQIDSFSEFHPIINFIFFGIVLLISMFSMHPVIIVISLCVGMIYLVHLKGFINVLKGFKYLLFMCLMIIIVNPLFNHEGMTILRYLKNGNALTAESIIYGVFMALLMASVITWFGCYNIIMSSDKFIYLFGRVIPHLSLILSMSLRYIPRFKTQFVNVRKAQKCIGRDCSDGNIFERIKHLSVIISIMISWSLENSIETADSMKSRGYGITKRTSFSIYKFDKRDKNVLIIMLGGIVLFVIGIIKEKMYYRYFPTFEKKLFNCSSICMYVIFTFICCLPMIIDFMEDRKWKYLESVN